jgi:plasmid stabilization system protein ParE
LSFSVRYAASAREDLNRLYDFLLERAQSADDFELAERALASIIAGIGTLERQPFLYRKAGQSAFLRELLMPFGGIGYVVLYEIDDASTVTVLAVRHQSEDDYH